MIAEFLVADVALIEPRLRMHSLAESSLQVVRYDHIVAVVDQFIYRVASNVAGTAQYQNSFHRNTSFLKKRRQMRTPASAIR